MPKRESLTVVEAAARLAVPAGTIWSWLNAGKFDSSVDDKNRRILLPDEFEAIEKHVRSGEYRAKPGARKLLRPKSKATRPPQGGSAKVRTKAGPPTRKAREVRGRVRIEVGGLQLDVNVDRQTAKQLIDALITQ